MAARALSVGLLWLSACAAPVGETQVAAGLYHTCELRGGMLRCWGADDFGQLGGDTLGRPRGARSVGAGGNTTCVVDAFGAVLCAGQNHHGQLGDGTLEARAVLSPVAGLGPASEVAVGFAHACARTAAGVICCWGWGASGQLMPGGDTDSSSPICREMNARRVVSAGGPARARPARTSRRWTATGPAPALAR